MAKGIITRGLTITKEEQTTLRNIFWAIENLFENEDIGDYVDDVYDILENLTRTDGKSIYLQSFDADVILKVEENEEKEA